MRKLMTLLAALVAAFAITVVPAGAVTDGELDGNRHPAVVLLLMEVGGQPAFRCSGTLLSATVLDRRTLYERLRRTVHGDEGVHRIRRPERHRDHQQLSLCRAERRRGGQLGCSSALRDGALLRPRCRDRPPPGAGGRSPAVSIRCSAFGRSVRRFQDPAGSEKVTFTSVGYGLQQIKPVHVQGARVRMLAHPRLIQINGGIVGDFSMLLSNNHSTGGTCSVTPAARTTSVTATSLPVSRRSDSTETAPEPVVYSGRTGRTCSTSSTRI